VWKKAASQEHWYLIMDTAMLKESMDWWAKFKKNNNKLILASSF